MADTSGQPPIHVTAEERLHPAFQKLARAYIALARLQRKPRQDEVTNESVDSTAQSDSDDQSGGSDD